MIQPIGGGGHIPQYGGNNNLSYIAEAEHYTSKAMAALQGNNRNEAENDLSSALQQLQHVQPPATKALEALENAINICQSESTTDVLSAIQNANSLMDQIG